MLILISPLLTLSSLLTWERRLLCARYVNKSEDTHSKLLNDDTYLNKIIFLMMGLTQKSYSVYLKNISGLCYISYSLDILKHPESNGLKCV